MRLPQHTSGTDPARCSAATCQGVDPAALGSVLVVVKVTVAFPARAKPVEWELSYCPPCWRARQHRMAEGV